MRAKPFLNVKNQIGFCGIWCGSCIVGNGVLKELTKNYQELIEKYGLEEWAPKDFDFKEFKKGLVSIQNIPLCPGCLKGGGIPDCEIRSCAKSKNISDCSECDRPEDCEHSEKLKKMRTGSVNAGLMVKMKKADRRKLINKWTRELERRFPHCLLFMG
jgi:hypothetical protein